MQRKTEPSVVNDCISIASKVRCRCHHHSRSGLRGPTIKSRHKFLKASKKPFLFTRRRDKIKLPTRFLLGGTISDPLNLKGLQKESDEQSDIQSFEINGQVSTPKQCRISFPHITDTSDPLNLKNVYKKEPASLSDHCITSMEDRKNACSKDCCQGVLANEDISEQHCLHCSSDTTESICSCGSGLALDNGHQHGVEVPDGSLNNCKADDVLVDAAVKVSSNVADENIFSEVEAIACTSKERCTSCEKVVSPALPQFSRHRARKRRRRSLRASPETAASAASSSDKSSSKRSKEKFPRGNYVAYYGYRNVDRTEDPRLKLLPKELFEGKEVLDIGCNAGLVTIAVASNYLPKRILGIDVDQRLIGLAKQNVRRYLDENAYPSCLKTAFGPIAASVLPSSNCSAFPHNILFQVGDYVPSSEVDLCRQCAEYDVILALSVTKWIHLTHGDDGLRRAFRRMYLQLRPGGKLFLEAQPWASYKRKKKLTEKIYEVYRSISFKPEQFNNYLLSAEVGFSSCELLGTPPHKSKGFQRSIYLFTKPHAAAVATSSA